MSDKVTWGPVRDWEPGNLHTLMPDNWEEWGAVRTALDSLDERRVRVMVTVEVVEEEP